jgi:anti-sigma regulatory factor (Ser/Thr protein kinase)
MTVTMRPRATSGFDHEALFYAGADEFLAGTVPFVREGVAAGEPVLVLVCDPRLSALRSALGVDAKHVTFADMATVGRNPAWIIPAWRAFLADNGGGERPLRGIGEPIWAGRSPDELVECQRHEELLNLAFAGPEVLRVLCPYDVAALDASIIDEAERSHPTLSHRHDRRPSGMCRDLETIARPFDAPLAAAPSDARSLAFDAMGLVDVRDAAMAVAQSAGLSALHAEDVVLAVHELATNSVRYGGGSGMFRCWRDERTLIFEIADAGRIVDPLAGRKRPPPEQPGGRGLWIANQLCDLVQIRTLGSGNVIRVHVRTG